MMRRIWFPLICVMMGILSALLVFSNLNPLQIFSQSRATPPLVDPFLTSGKLADGEAAFTEWLKNNPNDDKARFSLGTIQLLRGTERLLQSLYRFGLNNNDFASFFPIFQLPVPPNPTPQTLKYTDLNQIFQTASNDLAQVRQTLAPIKDTTLKLPLRLGLIKIDFDGDGKFTDKEVLWRVFSTLTGIRTTPQQAEQFLIGFDYGDVLWLRGYTHIFSSMLDFLLAYDRQEIFEATAHLFFPKPDTPHTFLITKAGEFDNTRFLDFIASLHLLRFNLTDPTKMAGVRDHLLQTMQLSRSSWEAIMAETDNDREWLPNPKQKAIFPNTRVTQAMIDNWIAFTKEGEELLNGNKIAPFWRNDSKKRGINLKRIFTEPRTFDLILWAQGTAATPYLENGKLTDARIWDNLFRTFGDNLVPFSLWFN